MQAIQTKYLPATNMRGARIKATCERGSLTISYPHDKSGEDAHREAVDRLVARFVKEDAARYGSKREANPWARWHACAGLPRDGSGYVFTRTREQELYVMLLQVLETARKHRWRVNQDERNTLQEATRLLERLEHEDFVRAMKKTP